MTERVKAVKEKKKKKRKEKEKKERSFHHSLALFDDYRLSVLSVINNEEPLIVGKVASHLRIHDSRYSTANALLI